MKHILNRFRRVLDPPPPSGTPSETSALIVELLTESIERAASPWLTTQEAAFYISSSVSTINRWKNQGNLQPYYGPGMTNPRYKRTDLDALMKNKSRAHIRIRITKAVTDHSSRLLAT
jgi:hypothetical protein